MILFSHTSQKTKVQYENIYKIQVFGFMCKWNKTEGAYFILACNKSLVSDLNIENHSSYMTSWTSGVYVVWLFLQLEEMVV